MMTALLKAAEVGKGAKSPRVEVKGAQLVRAAWAGHLMGLEERKWAVQTAQEELIRLCGRLPIASGSRTLRLRPPSTACSALISLSKR
jgi:hypothetical protein